MKTMLCILLTALISVVCLAQNPISDGPKGQMSQNPNSPEIPYFPPPVESVPAGEYEMGDHHDGMSNAVPVHTVYIDMFDMDVFEVTNREYRRFLNDAYKKKEIIVDSGVVYKAGAGTSYPYCDTYPVDPGSRIHWTGSSFEVELDKMNHPMVEVSWYGTVAYANWRSEKVGLPPSYDLESWECTFGAGGYRLPTEAEWEYAARGGELDPYLRFPWGDELDGSKANYWNSGDPYETGDYPWTTPGCYYDGGQEPNGVDMANGYGLYDMAGNVWEWCNDWYDADYYQYCVDNNINDNPTGPSGGGYTHRVLRGGSWDDEHYNLRCARRGAHNLSDRDDDNGFRLVLDSP